MTQPIQGRARIRVEADTSRLTGEVLSAVQAAVAAAQTVLRDGLTADGIVLSADEQPLLDAVQQAREAVEQLDDTGGQVTLVGNARPLLTAAAQAQQAVEQIGGAADAIILDSDIDPLLAAVHAAQEAVAELSVGADQVVLDGDPGPLLDKVEQAQQAVAALAAGADDVALGADPRQLLEQVAAAQAAIRDLQALGPEVTIDGDATPLVAETQRAGESLQGLTGLADIVGSAVTAALAAGAAGGAALGAAVITAGIGFNALSQSVNQGLTAVLGTRDAARDLINEVIELNATAAFSRQAFLASTQQLVGFGVEAGQVTTALDAMQQAVVAVGGGEAEFARLTEILALVASQGQATGDTVARLGALGINLAQIIADTTGQAVSEVEQAIAAGQVGLEEITQALQTRYAGAVAGYADTWSGAIGMVLAGIRNIGSALMEPFVGLERGGMAIDLLNAVAEVLFAIQRQAGPLAQILEGRLAPAVDAVTGGLESAAGWIDQLDLDQVVASASEAAPALAALAAALSTAGSAALLSAIPGLGGLAAAMNPLAAAVVAAALATPELRDALVDLAQAAAPLAPIVGEVTVMLAGLVSTGLSAIAEAVAPAVTLLADLLDVFVELPGPVQQATLAIAAFALALRFGGPVGTALAAIAALGAAVEGLKAIFGDGADEAARLGAGVNLLASDLERFGRTGVADSGVEDAIGTFERLGDELRRVSDPTFWEGMQDEWRRLFTGDGPADQVEILAEFTDELAGLDSQLAALVSSGNLEGAEAAYERLAERAEAAGVPHEVLMELLPGYARELERAGLAADETAESQDRLTDSTSRLTEALQEHHEQLLAQADPLFALHRAMEDVEVAQNAYTDAVDRYGEASPEAEAAGLALAESVLRVQAAAINAGDSLDDNFIASMRASLEAAGLAEPQINAVIGALTGVADAGDSIRDEYATSVAVDGVDAAVTAIDSVQRRIADIDRVIDIHFNVTGQAPVGSINLPMAQGGLVTGPTHALIGEEHQPEVVMPLSRPGRMVELLRHPTVLTPMVDALGTVVSAASPATRDRIATRLGVGGDGGGLAPLLIRQPGPVSGSELDELQALRAAVTRGLGDLQAVMRQARPVNIPVTQAPGEDGEALAARVVSRMTLAGVL